MKEKDNKHYSQQIEILNNYFKTHTTEEIQKDWNETKDWDNVGPTIEEYFNGPKLEYEKYKKKLFWYRVIFGIHLILFFILAIYFLYLSK